MIWNRRKMNLTTPRRLGGRTGDCRKAARKGEMSGSERVNMHEISRKGRRARSAELGERSFLTTIERQGGRENRKLGKAEGRATESWPQRGAASGSMQVNEQPKVGPKGEGVGTTESNDTDIHNRESWQIRGRATEGWPEGRIETLGKVENRKPGRAEGRATGGWPEGRGIGGDASQRLPRGSSEGGAGWENLRIK